MEGIKFDRKIGIFDLILSGQKTMFRLVSNSKRAGKVYDTKYRVGQKIALLQTYKDAGIEPNFQVYDKANDYKETGDFISVAAKDSKGWTNISAVSPELMPYFIEIISVKSERISEITNEDCYKEGIVPVSCNDLFVMDGNMPFDGFSIDGKTWLGDSPQEAFIAISNRAVKKDAWKNNVKVDVYEFKLVKRICG